MRFQGLKINHHDGATTSFSGQDNGVPFHDTRFPLFLIEEAWARGCDFGDIADGLGHDPHTRGGVWRGIRDSSNTAITEMFERAMNHLFGNKGY